MYVINGTDWRGTEELEMFKSIPISMRDRAVKVHHPENPLNFLELLLCDLILQSHACLRFGIQHSFDIVQATKTATTILLTTCVVVQAGSSAG